MAKIQGYLGKRSSKIGILQSGFCPATKRRDWIAIEKFTGVTQTLYIATPIPEDLKGEPERLNRFLKSHRPQRGYYTTEEQWKQGTKSAAAPKGKTDRTAKDLHAYTYEISGDLHRKRPAAIRSIIRRHQDSNAEFMALIQV